MPRSPKSASGSNASPPSRRSSSNAWTEQERSEVDKLVALYEELDVEDPFVDRASCQAYLSYLEVCAECLGVDALPRTYRNSFSTNYRYLFKDDHKREYQIDLMQASADRCPSMCVNGQMCFFSKGSVKLADKLMHQCNKLYNVLKFWSAASKSPASPSKEVPTKAEVRAVLFDLDRAWAYFEQIYIDELISIEAVARKPLVDAVIYERRLARLEGYKAESGAMPDWNHSQYSVDYAAVLEMLFECLAELNMKANSHGTGRDDLNPGAMCAAWEVLVDDLDDSASSGSSHILRSLAEDLDDSFRAMREYLRNVGCSMERVDPQLNKNSGLVSRLEDFENAWELCHKYIQDEAMRDALAQSAQAISAAQVMVPDLRRMCSDCDAEVFLVLPRLLWLGFLREPKYNKLFDKLLPDCFIEIDCFHHSRVDETWEKAEDAETTVKKSTKLQSLVDHFNTTLRLLVDAQGRLCTPQAKKTAEIVAWEILTFRVVIGAGVDDEDTYERLTPSLQEKSRSAVENFMRDLEAWSIELQRHCPKDWNACSALIVQWISGELKKDRQVPFRF